MTEGFHFSYSQFDLNVSQAFKTLRGLESFSDVTLVCTDGELSAHKFVLFTSSQLFQEILPRMKQPNPYIFLKGIKLSYLEPLMSFMYTGQVEVSQKDLGRVLKTAKDLGVKGLIEATEEQREEAKQQASAIKKQLAELMQTEKTESETISDSPTTGETMEEEETMEESTNINVLEPQIDLEEGGVDIQTEEEESDTVEIENTNPEESVIIDASELTVLDPVKDLDERAAELMEKTTTEENRVSWVCKVCGKSGGDKSNIRRHVKGKHLKNKNKDLEKKMSLNESTTPDDYDVNDAIEVDLEMELDETEAEVSLDNTEEDVQVALLDDLDLQALERMEREVTGDGRVSWTCKVCGKTANDKTRIRKHVISHLRGKKRPEETEDVLDEPRSWRTENYSPDDFNALKLMEKKRDSEGVIVWTCTVCSKTNSNKTNIRKHIIAIHRDSL